MFILIPLILILASILGVFVIVWRKIPYLKTVVVEADASQSLVHDYFPELIDFIKELNLEEYKDVSLVELEKFLRRLRVVSLRMDRFSDSLIKKIRKIGEGSKIKPIIPTVVENKENVETVAVKPQRDTTLDDMRREEQRLIIEVAKNPKNPGLYEVLGDLYVKMNNFSDAKDSYEAAMELSPANIDLKKKHSQVLENMSK